MALTVEQVEQNIATLNQALNRTAEQLLRESPKARELDGRIQTWTEVLQALKEPAKKTTRKKTPGK
jgi:hypothetical protein